MAKILITDDEREIADIISDFIKEHFEAEIDICSDGAGAQYKLDNNEYDLLITDLKMKNLGGIALLKMIKKGMVKYKPMHTWIISGYISEEQGVQLEENNVIFFQKPIDFVLFKEKLSELFIEKK